MGTLVNLSVADVILLSGLVLSIVAGAIRIGVLSNQISINTKRLGCLEQQSLDFQTHAANTNARWPDIERRLHRAETIINHVTIKKEFDK